MVASAIEALPVSALLCCVLSYMVLARSNSVPLVPLIEFLLVAGPISWAYGAALYIYEDGVLSWTKMPCLMPVREENPADQVGGLSWIVPIATISVMIGIHSSYTVRVMSHILDFFDFGYDKDDSILFAISDVGP